MKEYNETSVIVACKNLLDNSDDVLRGNAVSTKGCLYWDIHNSLIDVIGLLGGDITKYSYIDPDNPDMEGRI